MLGILTIRILDGNVIICEWELRGAEHHTLTIDHRTNYMTWKENKLEMMHVWKQHHPWLCKKINCVGSQMEASPGTMSNPDGTMSMGGSSGRGVAMWTVDVGADADVVVVRAISMGEPCWWSTQVYWPPPALRIVCKLFVWSLQKELTQAIILECRNWRWQWGMPPEMYWEWCCGSWLSPHALAMDYSWPIWSPLCQLRGVGFHCSQDW